MLLALLYLQSSSVLQHSKKPECVEFSLILFRDYLPYGCQFVLPDIRFKWRISIYIAQDRDTWQALVNAGMNLRVL